MGTAGRAEELLSGLTAAQREAVISDAAPLCIVAAAGAGKTRVLTRRIAYRCVTGSDAPRHTLAVTFTRKAAGELRTRLAALGLREGVAAGTFHSHAAAQLQRWWADRRQTPPTLIDRKSRVLGPIVSGRPGLERVPLAELASAIEWAKARGIDADRFEEAVAGRPRLLPAGVTPAAGAALYGRYEHEKRRRGLIDFDDLLSRCAEAIEGDPEFAAAQRWQWRHVYVDEYQDLNPLQHRLLLAWMGASTDLCVVGDPNQAIYGWNGADPTLLTDLPRMWPSAVVIRLDANHRSTEQIVRVAAAVLGAAGERLRAAGRRGAEPVVRSYESDGAEARAITAELVAAHADGVPWSSMAVLTRTNAQLAAISSALGSAGIPWWSAAAATLLEDPRIRAMATDWRARGHQPLQTVLADMAELLNPVGHSRAADHPPAKPPEGPGAHEIGPELSGLLDAGRAFLAMRPDASVAEWLDWLPTAGRDRSAQSDRDAVTLSSFHRAKGLEWSRVWVAGVEEGLVPIHGSVGPAETEERQLLYVALTRAVDTLSVSWARSRSFGGRSVPRQASRWLADIESATAESVPEGDAIGTAGWRRRLDEQKAGLRQAGGPSPQRSSRRLPNGGPEPDPTLRVALREWRLKTARESGVPPHVLLHDATVEALAAIRPSTASELLAVPGFGPVKAQRYGAPILGILTERAVPA